MVEVATRTYEEEKAEGKEKERKMEKEVREGMR